MNKFLLSLFSLSSLCVASTAFGQGCPPGAVICAGGSLSVGVQFGTQPPPPPPSQVVVVEQPPPVYVVQRPPPPVVVQQPIYYTTTTTTVSYLGLNGRARGLGLGGFLSGLGFGSQRAGASGMGGGGGTMRFRTHPMFAGELSIAGMMGTDYNRDTRTEFPVTVSGIVYFNPQNRFQLYGVVGMGVSLASVTYNDARSRPSDTATYAYFGGLAGFGAEWQLSPHFSIFGDARAFIRTRIDREANDNPEFTRVDSEGRRETTNVSAGVVGQLGGIFYF